MGLSRPDAGWPVSSIWSRLQRACQIKTPFVSFLLPHVIGESALTRLIALKVPRRVDVWISVVFATEITRGGVGGSKLRDVSHLTVK